MKPAPFEYVRPSSLDEACRALAGAGGAAVALAGGQSLMPLLALRVASADLVVDIGRLEVLKSISRVDGGTRIGAGVTHAEIEDGKAGDAGLGLLQRVAAGIAYRAVRNHGTIGGSVALADPAADWPACLLALSATARISGPGGGRTETLDRLLHGAYTTSLAQGEIITAFDVPDPPRGTRCGWAKVVRKSGAFATSIACVVRPAGGAPARAVLGGTTSRPELLPGLGALISRPATPAEADLRAVIAADLATAAPDADAYQQRLHTATILRAVREAVTP